MTNVEETYNSFWKDIVEKDGSVDMDAVKAELSDYHMVLSEVSTVYSHATGGELSKPNYLAPNVIACIEEHYERERKEFILDDLDFGIARVDTFDDDLFENIVDRVMKIAPDTGTQVAEEFAESLLSHFREVSITE